MTPGLGSYAFRWSVGHKDLVPPRPMSPHDLITVTGDLGLSVLQYADNVPLEGLSGDELERLRHAADARKITLEIGIQTFDADLLKRYFSIAKRLNAKIIRIALDAADAKTPLDRLAQDVAAVLPAAEKAGCRLAIENHFDFPSPRMVSLLKLVDDDRVGVCLDVANSICAGEWPQETVALLAPWTINLHLKDYVIAPDPYGVGFRIQGCPLGEGRTHINAVLKALDHRAMSVIYEHWLPWPGSFEEAQQAEHKWANLGASKLKGLLD